MTINRENAKSSFNCGNNLQHIATNFKYCILDSTRLSVVQNRVPKTSRTQSKCPTGALIAAQRIYLLTAVSLHATEIFGPPLTIFPRKNLNHLPNPLALSSTITCQPSGWIRFEVCMERFEYWVSVTKIMCIRSCVSHTRNIDRITQAT